MIVAQLAWDLQALSRGRFILGLGSQIRAHIERRFGQPWSQPGCAHARVRARAARDLGVVAGAAQARLPRRVLPAHADDAVLRSRPLDVPAAARVPRRRRAAHDRGRGEVADGFFVHPFHTPEFVRDRTLPALERGLARAGRTRDELEIACQVDGRGRANAATSSRARAKPCAVRSRSTPRRPAYRGRARAARLGGRCSRS